MSIEYIEIGIAITAILVSVLPFIKDVATTLKKDCQNFLLEFSSYSENIAPSSSRKKCIQRSFSFLTNANIDISMISKIVLSEQYIDIVKYCRQAPRHLETLCSRQIKIKSPQKMKLRILLEFVLVISTISFLSFLISISDDYLKYIHLDIENKKIVLILIIFIVQLLIARKFQKSANKTLLECSYIICTLEYLLDEDENKQKRKNNNTIINAIISTK